MMNNFPAISVIVPVYNVERFLGQALDSILKQTFSDFELICVNDGSTDSSLKILNRYQALDNRIKVVSQSNGGLSAARNTGLKNAHGKYVMFIDSDDFIYPETLSCLYERAVKTNSEITICNLKLWFEDTKSWGYFRDEVLYLRLENKVFSLSDVPELIGIVAAWDRLILRQFLLDNNIKFLDGLIYEDVPFGADCLTKAKRISVVRDHFYCYRKNAGGSITDDESKNKKCRTDFLKTRKYTYDVLKQANVSDDVWYYYLLHFVQQAVMHNNNCNTQDEFRLFFQGLQELMDEKLYMEAALRFKDEFTVVYFNFLKNGSWEKAWKLLKG